MPMVAIAELFGIGAEKGLQLHPGEECLVDFKRVALLVGGAQEFSALFVLLSAVAKAS